MPPKETVSLRPYEPGDEPFLERLERVGDVRKFIGGIRGQRDVEVRRIIIDGEGQPVGFACLAPTDYGEPGAYRELVCAMDPARQGRGHGRRACLAMIQLARDDGFTLIASVDRENEKALALVRRLGARVIGERPGGVDAYGFD